MATVITSAKPNTPLSYQAQKQFAGVDIIKFICAILVVIIHVAPFTDSNPELAFFLKQYVGRIAVPFFFISNGFFCFKKLDEKNLDLSVPFNYAKRMLMLNFIWLIIYLPRIYLTLVKVKPTLLLGIHNAIRVILFSGYVHLWYLPATAFAVIVIAIAIKKKIKIEALLVFGGLMYIFGLMGDSYFGFLKYVPDLEKLVELYLTVFEATRNGLLEGILFVGIGVLFAYRKIKLNRAVAFICFVFSMGLMLFEVYTLKDLGGAKDYNISISLVPASFFMFYLAISSKQKANAFTHALRAYSSTIYFTHIYFQYPLSKYAIDWLKQELGIEFEIPSLFKLAFTIVGSLAISFIIINLEKLKGFRWLKKLH